MLESCGLEVSVATPADDLVALVRGQSESELRADLLVVDVSAAEPIELELIEGFQNELQTAVPIVALIAPGGKIDVAERCRDLGIELCLTKPIKMHELTSAVVTALGDETSMPTGDQSLDDRSQSHRLRILVADDSSVNQEVAVGSARIAWAPGQNRQFRARSDRTLAARTVRFDIDGCRNARCRRPGRHRGHPPARSGPAAADRHHRHDRPRQ